MVQKSEFCVERLGSMVCLPKTLGLLLKCTNSLNKRELEMYKIAAIGANSE